MRYLLVSYTTAMQYSILDTLETLSSGEDEVNICLLCCVSLTTF
jgi:hypothetical protein